MPATVAGSPMGKPGARLEGLTEANGCLHHPDCFTCPFPDCVELLSVQTVHRAVRNERVLRAYRNGESRGQICRHEGLSYSAVLRIVRKTDAWGELGIHGMDSRKAHIGASDRG